MLVGLSESKREHFELVENQLESILKKIDGTRYSSYRVLLGKTFRVDGVELEFTRIQGDPYAPPSILELRAEMPGWSKAYSKHPVPIADTMYRVFWRALARASRRIGEGFSGRILAPRPSPLVIARSALQVKKGSIVARIRVGLPSKRRRILGEEALDLLKRVVHVFKRSVLENASLKNKVASAVALWRDQEYIRRWLRLVRAVAFIGEGSILPRKCGGCFEPLEDAVPFDPPPSMAREIVLPSGRQVTGMVIEEGTTLVIGSAFHGKTTLLEAVAEGVWNHVAGDGRELVITVRSAVVVKTEQGRSVACVDISPFIEKLPAKTSTHSFTTSDASGATSVAASIQEVVEAGSRLLILDEDDVATNILYEDLEASKIISWKTVRPVSLLARSMNKAGVSILIASQGSLQLYWAADRVVLSQAYRYFDVTEQAKRLLPRDYGEKIGESRDYRLPRPRRLRIRRVEKPRIKNRILVARNIEAPIVLAANTQLVEETQWRTLEAAARILESYNNKSLARVAYKLEEYLSRGEFSVVANPVPPELGEIRAQDITFLANRLPWLCGSSRVER